MLFVLLLLLLCFHSYAVTSNSDYLIACGIPKSTYPTSEDGSKIWWSDDNSTFATADINRVSSGVRGRGDEAPYTAARIFNSSFTYSFPVSPGPKYIRLYFTTTTPYHYNNTQIPPSQFFLSVDANGFTLLKNFSAFLNSQNSTQSNIVNEFHLTVHQGEPLKLTFSPSSTTSYGFINGIEIITVPEGLYFNATRTPPPMFDDFGYSSQQDMIALQKVYRINVGGNNVQLAKDSGGLSRLWQADQDYIVGNFWGATSYTPDIDKPIGSAVNYTAQTPSYVAPRNVYATLRIIGLKDYRDRVSANLTWKFDVDSGFDYLVRLHFCELDMNVTGTHQRVFYVDINNNTPDVVDVWDISGGRGLAVFRDYVVRSNYNAQTPAATKVPLWLTLRPKDSSITDVLLNGLEILKLNQSDGNLAVPNPPSSADLHIIITGSRGYKATLTKSKIALLASCSAVGIGILIFLVFCQRRCSSKDEDPQRKRKPDVDAFLRTHGTVGLQRYTYSELKKMTNSFKDKLGEGGYGAVYKGKTTQDTKHLVAVKMLKKSEKNAEDFINEVASIGKTNHINVVSLLGFCYVGRHRALVYDFMPNGSLEKYIYGKNNLYSLAWDELFQIAVGIARGLEYLHRGCNTRILHFDIKPHNILLDKNFCPKISDFGLAKLCPQKESLISISEARGTVGYIAPEVFLRSFGGVSYKSDVYSYGMLVLEMVGCRRKTDIEGSASKNNSEQYFPQWIYDKLEVGEEFDDQEILSNDERGIQKKMILVSLWCVKTNPSSRPEMRQVVEMLEGAVESLEVPRIASLAPISSPLARSLMSESQTMSRSFNITPTT